MTIQIKAIEQYVHVVLFIMLYNVVVTFKSVGETLIVILTSYSVYFNLCITHFFIRIHIKGIL